MTRIAALALLPLLSAGLVEGAQAPTTRTASQPVPPPSAGSVQPPAAPSVAPSVPPVLAELAAHEVREDLQRVLRGLPPAIGQVLRHDPSLLTRADYLAPYPALAAFLAQHPEVPLNASYFLGSPGEWDDDAESRGLRMAENVMDGLGVFVVISTFLGFFAWVLRTVIDHRRWLRQSKVQVEVHAKVLDRLSSHDDLLAYVQSPAGRRFLEAAPIEVDGQPRPSNSALTRVLFSVQAGLVLLALGVGFWVAQVRLGDAGKGFSLLSTLGMALGVGFVLSALASYAISTRHGLIGAQVRAQHE
jgi:hypothetical protein